MALGQVGSAKSTATMRWVLIAIAAGLGLFLFLRAKNSNAQTQQSAAQQSAAAQGDTTAGTNSTNVPTYSLAASGTYNGGYTPYTILNTSPTNMSDTFPASSMGANPPTSSTTNSNSVTSAGITNSQTTTQYGS